MRPNLLMIEGSVEETVEQLLESVSSTDIIHFTNGTYALPVEKILPSTLEGFDYIERRDMLDNSIFVIAINSDASMEGIMNKRSALFDSREDELAKRNASQEEFDAFDKEFEAFDEQRQSLEDQMTRAMKIAVPLAEEFSSRPVIVVFYDEETPTALYDAIKAAPGLNFATLQKHGYGTDKDAPRIEGAHNADRVIAFPLPGNEKALCHDITVGEDQTAFVKVVDLTKEFGARRTYIPQKPQVGSGAPIPPGFH